MKTTKYKIFCMGCTICGSDWHNRSSCPWIQNKNKVSPWLKGIIQ